MRCLFEVERFREAETTELDRYGNPVRSRSSAFVKVYGVAPTGTSDTDSANRDAKAETATVYAPVGADLRERDELVVPWMGAGRWIVEGIPKQWMHNPESRRAREGIEVKIERKIG